MDASKGLLCSSSPGAQTLSRAACPQSTAARMQGQAACRLKPSAATTCMQATWPHRAAGLPPAWARLWSALAPPRAFSTSRPLPCCGAPAAGGCTGAVGCREGCCTLPARFLLPAADRKRAARLSTPALACLLPTLCCRPQVCVWRRQPGEPGPISDRLVHRGPAHPDPHRALDPH